MNEVETNERNIHDVTEAPETPESVNTEEVMEEVESIPVGGGQPMMMSPAMQEEMMRQQREFFNEVIKTTAIKVLTGEVSGIIGREFVPKSGEVLMLDDDASSWNISIMVTMMEILKEDEVFDDKGAISFLEAYIDLFNRRFITYHLWKNEIEKFIVKNVKTVKKVPSNINWNNFTEWVRYSLINTNPIRSLVVGKYFQPTESQETQPQE